MWMAWCFPVQVNLIYSYYSSVLYFISLFFSLKFLIFEISSRISDHSKHLQTNQNDTPQTFLESIRIAIQMPFLSLFLKAIPFSVLWFCANYAFTIAIRFTSVATALTLEQVCVLSSFFQFSSSPGFRLQLSQSSFSPFLF
jgi:hypothetical protein